MYIVESGATPRVIRIYDVVDNGTRLANGRTINLEKVIDSGPAPVVAITLYAGKTM